MSQNKFRQVNIALTNINLEEPFSLPELTVEECQQIWDIDLKPGLCMVLLPTFNRFKFKREHNADPKDPKNFVYLQTDIDKQEAANQSYKTNGHMLFSINGVNNGNPYFWDLQPGRRVFANAQQDNVEFMESVEVILPEPLQEFAKETKSNIQWIYTAAIMSIDRITHAKK